VLGTRDDDNNLIAEQLTVDLKPNLPSMVSLSLSLSLSNLAVAAKVALKLKEMFYICLEQASHINIHSSSSYNYMKFAPMFLFTILQPLVPSSLPQSLL
jgi:hypothetical protein